MKNIYEFVNLYIHLHAMIYVTFFNLHVKILFIQSFIDLLFSIFYVIDQISIYLFIFIE